MRARRARTRFFRRGLPDDNRKCLLFTERGAGSLLFLFFFFFCHVALLAPFERALDETREFANLGVALYCRWVRGFVCFYYAFARKDSGFFIRDNIHTRKLKKKKL